jgi:nicotinamide-nucleotide amidase
MASCKINDCSKIIAEKKLKIAFVESATAGWMASEFALIPESGEIFLGGMVCYDQKTKEELFNIPSSVFQTYTAESAEVTLLLAKGLNKYFKSDISVAVTGLIAPGGSETPSKPVGTMFICIQFPDGEYHQHRANFSGKPKEIISKTIDWTVQRLFKELEKI